MTNNEEVVSTSLGLTTTERRAFVSAFIGWLFDYYEIFVLTFLLIPIAVEFDLSGTQSAWIVSASLISLAAGGVIFGPLADRIGRRRVLIITLLVYSLATLARAGAPNYEILMVLTVIAGLGLGGEYGVGQSLVAETLRAGRRGWWSGLLYGGAFLAIMLAAVVGGYLLPAVGWRWTFAISGAPALFALYMRTNTPESAVWEKATRSAARPTARDYLSRSFLRPFIICLVPATMYFWAYYGVTTLLPRYLVDQGFSLSKASWWIFFTAAAGLIGCLIGSWATDIVGRKLTLCALMTTAAVGGMMLYLAGTDLITSAWVLLPFFVMYFGSNAPTVFGSLFSEMFSTRLRSTGVSSSLQIARATSALPPLLAAGWLESHGYGSIFIVATALYAGVALWAWVFPETKGINLDEVESDSSQGASNAPVARR